MDDTDLRRELRVILDLEAVEPTDWSRVQQLSADLSQRLSRIAGYAPPHLVDHYLDDVDIRQRDPGYADHQRSEIQRFVETGDRAPLESEPVTTWSCLLVLGCVLAVACWLLL